MGEQAGKRRSATCAADNGPHAMLAAETKSSGEHRLVGSHVEKASDGAEALASDPFGVHAGNVFSSWPLMSALSFGLYMSWVYLACFSTKLYPVFGATGGMAAQGELASFVGYIAWIAVCVATYRRLSSRWGSRVLVLGVMASAATACVAAASMIADVAIARALVVGASLLGGAAVCT